MTPIQADNWRQFATRMAWESHRYRTAARRNLVIEIVTRLIDVHINNYGLAGINSWDDGSYCGDEFDRLMSDWSFSHWNERKSEERETDFNSAVMCCVRAGFDVAVHPSAGVIGSRYTVGMIRRMFPEGLPAYVDTFFHGPDVDPGTPRLDTLPASMQVWL